MVKSFFIRLLKLVKEALIIVIFLSLFFGMFFGAVLQASYRYCPPSEEEINQMGLVEHWLSGY